MTQAAQPLNTRAAALDRLWSYVDYLLLDHALLRLVLPNAHRVSPEMIRAGQPWAFQLRRWRDQGVRSVVSLRGAGDNSFHRIERETCRKLGLQLHEFALSAVTAPTAAQVVAAKEMFDTLAYPALIHCKSGADRAGLMSALYSHFRLGEPIAVARRHLALRYGHTRAGKAGVLDYLFERYLAVSADGRPSFLEWVTGGDYDPVRLCQEFRSGRRSGA
jgi:protein tyrosine/serine phosphatase